jgi:hypothetical protein
MDRLIFVTFLFIVDLISSVDLASTVTIDFEEFTP